MADSRAQRSVGRPADDRFWADDLWWQALDRLVWERRLGRIGEHDGHLSARIKGLAAWRGRPERWVWERFRDRLAVDVSAMIG